jgi:cyclopropane-fatty-acyl-phospholipid synthase
MPSTLPPKMTSLDFKSYPAISVRTPQALKVPKRASLLLRLLKGLKIGHLSLYLPGRMPTDEPLEFGTVTVDQPIAQVYLRNWTPLEASIKSGDIGFAQSWIDGDWDSPDLTAVLSLAVANREVIEQAVYGSWLGHIVSRLKHLLHRNTKRGAARNVHAHYDLGNEFYRLWLDNTMTYSSALFEGDNQTAKVLAQGQKRKNQRLIEALALRPQARLLEIGCGWGGFAEQAAQAGFYVKGLTLSKEQHEFAERRVVASDQADRATFALQDYRDENGQYDGIASIEMFEAVGEEYWPQFFQTVKKCLKPGGRAIVQSITIRDDLFERYRSGSDFIQQYIFPGGMLPSIRVFKEVAEKHGLEAVETFTFGPDYAETLRQWRASFMSKIDQIKSLGFDQTFVRTWEFYLSYCEAAFDGGNTNVVQFTLRHGSRS